MRVRLMNTLAAFCMTMIVFFFNNCGETFKPGGTVTGNPLVGISFASYSSGPSSLTFCIAQISWKPRNSNFNIESQVQKGDFKLQSSGTDFTQVEIPAGVYDGVTLKLSKDCDSKKSLQVVNAQGFFTTLDELNLEFSGELKVSRAASRVIIDAQSLVSGLAGVASEANIAPVTQTTTGTVSVGQIPTTLTVASIYPLNSNWNDYVKNSNTTVSVYEQTDTACVGNESGAYSACIHGGEKRKVSAVGYSSCTGLSMTDSLSAFNWECRMFSGSPVFVSSGLALSKGLRNLLSSSGWIPNRVTLWQGGQAVAQSAATLWWSNGVYELSANSTAITLDSTDGDGAGPDQVYPIGAVFIISSDKVSNGYNLNSDKQSFVTLGTSTLSYSNSPSSNCTDANGENSSGTNDRRCLISSGGQKFQWIEAKLKGSSAGTDSLYYGFGQKFSRVYRSDFLDSTVAGAGGSAFGLNFDTATSNFVSQIHAVNISGGSAVGVYLWASVRNTLDQIQIHKVDGTGLQLDSTSTNNIVTRLTVANSGANGLYIKSNSSENIISGALLMASGLTSAHLRIDNSLRNTISHLTAAGQMDGLEVHINNASHNTTLSQALLLDSSLRIVNSNTNRFSQLAIDRYYEATGMNVTMSGSSSNEFVDNFLQGSLTCAGTGAGTGLTAGCGNEGSSTSNIVSVDIAGATSMKGRLTVEDTINSSDVNGTRPYASVSDWFGFENIFRGWSDNAVTGKDCRSGETCRIFDWRIKSSDSVLRNRSGDGQNANGAFTNGAACPTAIGGNLSVADQQTALHVYLINAFEIIGDGVGNDNGLCESSEACIYSPNFGVYQGDGDFTTKSCTFSNGTVSGVTMYAYPSNGG